MALPALIYIKNTFVLNYTSSSRRFFKAFMSKKSTYTPGEFQWAFLLPKYWGIWIGIVFLMLLAILPWAIQHRLATAMGELAFNS